MYELIVHEIAHAIGGESHKIERGEWPLEMKKAAGRSRDVGKVKLANLIEEDRKELEEAEEDG